jgi:hypothetical protein
MENFKLAFTDSTTFYGKDLEGFYSTALLKGTSKESFKLVGNVKSLAKIAKFNLGDIVQDADCTFGEAGSGTLSQKTITAHPFKINLEYCQRTFEQDYLGDLLRKGDSMPTTVEQYVLEQVALKVSDSLEKCVWKGSGATPNFTTEIGLEAKLLADNTVIDVTATTLSASNIIAQISRVYDAIPATIKDSESLVIYMGTKAASFYRQALANASAETYYMQNIGELQFLGVKIIVAAGMSDNRMVAAESNNLLLITDLMSDFDEISILPQRNVTGTPVVRFVALDAKFGVDFIYGAEIVYYN